MTNSIYDYSVPNSAGEEISLQDYQGKVMLIVNTASKCGFTSQYSGLQELYDKFKDQGLVVIALPCNQFGGQEPGSNAEVQEFCQLNYGLSFPVMGKIEVNGAGQHPLYSFLKGQASGLLNDNIKWNFTKFLVDREGNVVKRYGSVRKPKVIAADIQKLL
jgi:glutathione peroxidase